MLKLKKGKDYLKNQMDGFIWEFKIEDNIIYNLEVVYALIENHNNGDGKYCKPISILAISIIEALMVDLIWRLHVATNHFPEKASVANKKDEIKEKLEKATRPYEFVFKGQTYKRRRLKNFGFKELIDFFEEYKLLGNKSSDYEYLRRVSRFRNRVHIKNYHDNFEKDESRVFTETRTQWILDAVVKFINYFQKNYSRPW